MNELVGPLGPVHDSSIFICRYVCGGHIGECISISCLEVDILVFFFQANMSPNLSSENHLIQAKNINLILNTVSTLGYRYGSGKTNG